MTKPIHPQTVDTGAIEQAPVRLLSRRDIASLMTPSDYLEAVDLAFRVLKEGGACTPPPLHVGTAVGAFHGKAASLLWRGRSYVTLKLNGNFPGNPERAGLPTVQGAILLCDGDNGSLLAVLDSIEITLRRTAAATALAARHLARKNASTLAVCGCGAQARPQAEAIAEVRRLERVTVWDVDASKALRMATELCGALGVPATAAAGCAEAVHGADMIVTCTTARTPFLDERDVSPGAFVAAVGADNPHKNEIAPTLMASAKVVVDDLEQCLHMGDLHHAVDAAAMRAEDVHGDLGEIVTKVRAGRNNPEEIFIFDSTGVAIKDAASAAVAYERACSSERGSQFKFS